MKARNVLPRCLNPRTLFVLLLLSALLPLTGCFNLEVGIVTPAPDQETTATSQPTEPTATPQPTEPTATPTSVEPHIVEAPTPLTAPEEVQMARDAALTYLSEQYGEKAPAPDLAWRVELVTSGLVGAGKYQYVAGDWSIRIDYPVVAPHLVVYEVTIDNATAGFLWQGEVDANGQVTDLSAPPGGWRVVAWLGHVVGLPEGSEFDDYVSFMPEGAGEVGLTGADAEIESQIQLLRDRQGVGEYANFWGTLTCDVDDYGGCRLVVARLRYGQMMTDPEPVSGWEGSLISNEPGSQFDDYFVLAGDFPVGFGISALDPAVQTELEDLRDTGAVIRLWGEVRSGVPDAFGTQISVSRFEIVEPAKTVEATQPQEEATPTPVRPSETLVLDEIWLQHTNYQLGFSIKYPRAMMYFFGSCKWNEDGDHSSYRPEMSFVPVKVFEDGNTVYIANEYFHELTGETKETNADGGTRTFFSECRAVTNNLELLRDPENYYHQMWKIVVQDVHNDEELDGFLKSRYGSGCSLDEKVPSEQQEGVYDVHILGDGKHFSESTCPINYGTVVKYYPEGHKVIAWDTGQAYTFVGDKEYTKIYDGEMRDSFRFITAQEAREDLTAGLPAEDWRSSVVDLPVVGWYGSVHSEPDDSQCDDYFSLQPQGMGIWMGLTGASPAIEDQIVALRDKEEPGKYAHFWGTLTCNVPDCNACQLRVTHLRPDGPGPFFNPDPVEGWEGIIITRSDWAQIDDAFILAGNYPVHYGISSEDAGLAAQLEDLRNTRTVIRVWGQVTCGIPDANGCRIEVTRIEVEGG